jgi:hypothetical protein
MAKDHLTPPGTTRGATAVPGDVAGLKRAKEAAVEATTRVLLARHGFVPDPDSEEWEEEYRRQFAQASAANVTPPMAKDRELRSRAAEFAMLSGPPAQARWAESLREQRLKEIRSDELRTWLAGAWRSAKGWIETRELSAGDFLRRIIAEYEADQRRREKEAAAHTAELRAKSGAAEKVRREVEAAGITPKGLVELIDVSARTKPASIKVKLAQLQLGERRLRIFETVDPAVLLVIEEGRAGRNEYGVEYDEGLVADLRVFAEAEQLRVEAEALPAS